MALPACAVGGARLALGRALVHLVVGTLLVAALPGLLPVFGHQLAAFAARPELGLPLAGGLLLGVLLDLLLVRRFPVLLTFEHELTHALVALCFFRRVSGFKVTLRQGGEVRFSSGFMGSFGDDVITLAPYAFPTFAMVGVLLRPLVPAGWFPWYDLGLGAAFGFHISSGLHETRVNWAGGRFRAAGSSKALQTDIAARGFVFSGVFIFGVGLLVHVVLAALLLGGFERLVGTSGAVLDAALRFWRGIGGLLLRLHQGAAG